MTAGELLARMAVELDDLGAEADEVGASLARGGGGTGLQALDLLRQRALGLAACARALAEETPIEDLAAQLSLGAQRRRLLGAAGEAEAESEPELF